MLTIIIFLTLQNLLKWSGIIIQATRILLSIFHFPYQLLLIIALTIVRTKIVAQHTQSSSNVSCREEVIR
jgi:hypothetical protein